MRSLVQIQLAPRTRVGDQGSPPRPWATHSAAPEPAETRGRRLGRIASAAVDRLPPVSATAFGVALVRAAEADRTDPLFVDPLAPDFVAAAGWKPPEPTAEQRSQVDSLVSWIRVRTKFLDDVVLDACAGTCGQVVILAAGLDARAFRLGLGAEVNVFELDLPAMAAF